MRSAARELSRFQDEPRQLPSGSFGKSAFLRLGFEPRADRTVLSTLHRRAPFIVQQALYWDEEMPGLPCVCMISNAGGVLQGDRNRIEIDLAPQSQAHVTTQSATRIQEMDTNHATQTQTIRLGANSYLEYIPHPVIPHRNSRFAQETLIEIDPTATLVYSEVLMAGRKYYGERGEVFAYDLFSSFVRAVRPGGRLLFAEKFVVEPGRGPVDVLGIMGPFHMFGNLIVLAPKPVVDTLFDAAAPTYDEALGVAFGASRLPNDAGVIVKALGMEAAPVVAVLREFWRQARLAATGCALPDRFLWA
ncbi:urease accessory protein UreD [Thiocapsa rosea]|uniref:Urease accessory protein UreD n=1 Tax=Thiocapsa rosea TaxID=69360 RepID=A0A495VFX2_9GAMM|nr:urease accessory protein UreD [Thiocapsa rosea]RKT47355.1 urease accessory protein [Thiocapsa rosea]